MRVLLGIGGTEDSIEALRETVDRAAMTGDELTVAVLENPESERSPEAVSEAAQTELDGAEVEGDIRRVSGDPGSRLVEISEAEGFDQIVLGGGERSPMGKIRLGHIAEFVLLNARVSVKLVR